VGPDAFSYTVTDSRQQGTGTTVVVDVRQAEPNTLSIGSEHVCSVNAAGALFCWGRNFEGQLGVVTTDPWSPTPQPVNLGGPAKAVSLGGYHTCALLGDDTVKCWGDSGHGQAGTGQLPHPADVTSPTTVNLGLGRTAKAIATGDYHSCAILDDDTVKCWGKNDSGQLGTGDFIEAYTPSAPVSFDNGDGTFTELKAKALITPALATCALTLNDQVFCWGEGLDGRTGLGMTTNTNRPTLPVNFGTVGRPFELQANSCVQLDDGRVKCWGQNNEYKFGIGNFPGHVGDVPSELGDRMLATDFGGGEFVRSISVGGIHGCALMMDGSVRCAGYNEFGQLGYGDQVRLKNYLQSVDLGTSGGIPLKAKKVRAGGFSTCAVLEDDSMKCWGRGNIGQLGNGTFDTLGDAAGEMGDALPTLNFSLP
jgi:alpha-tubulin suppressor-like RCC1 family protein